MDVTIRSYDQNTARKRVTEMGAELGRRGAAPALRAMVRLGVAVTRVAFNFKRQPLQPDSTQGNILQSSQAPLRLL